MRIVYLSGSGQLGGAERCLLDIMATVKEQQPSWTLQLLSTRDGPLLRAVTALGCEARVVAIPERLASLGDAGASADPGELLGTTVRALAAVPATRVYRRALQAVLHQCAPDIIHSHGYKMHIMGTWSRPRSSALVWHLHDYVSSRIVMARAVSILSRRCDAAIAVSRSVAADASRIWRGRAPIEVVVNAIDLAAFNPAGASLDLDAQAGLSAAPAGTVRVGLVAVFGRFKGHEVFIRAIARLARDLPIRGYIVGGSLYETRGSEASLEQLRRLTIDLGVEDRVGFTGFVAAPAEAIRALDVVVHATTVPEPFGRVIAEAMGCGRALITSAVGGAAELIRPGIDAMTHRSGDAADLARAIEQLALDADLRARLGANGRRTAEERFDRRRFGVEIPRIYRSAVTGREANGRDT